jgi:NAD(P)-dependent dehydrogenase (short-subunit alcohol dehydrogenase family)
MSDNEASGDAAPVVITGTSTGIGAASALLLAEKGFRVFAGVRNAADGDALAARSSGELTPIPLDITDEVSISAAVDVVEGAVGQRGLFGLVNNAGIVKPGPLELQPMSDFRRQLEVNLVGQVAMTQAFLPLIRRGKGRIVNVGSIGGRVVLPLHGAYSASKFGMEAVSDALRLELRQWSIPVSHIDPGATETAIFGKTLDAIDEMAETLRERGRDEYEAQLSSIRRLVEKTAADAAPVDDLSKTVANALTAKKPKSRYLAGHGAEAAVVLARTATDGIKDRAIAREAHLPAPE